MDNKLIITFANNRIEVANFIINLTIDYQNRFNCFVKGKFAEGLTVVGFKPDLAINNC